LEQTRLLVAVVGKILRMVVGLAERNTWRLSAACRPTFLFVGAYAASLTPHEAVHALTAYYLGFSSTLYQMWVSPDAANARPVQIAIISGAGPIFSLVFGLMAWFVYRKCRYRPSSFIMLMLAVNNLYIVFGNMTSAGFGGDVNRALTALGAGVAVLYTTSFIGIACLTGFMFAMGRELILWAPVGIHRRSAVWTQTLAPWLIGTVIVLIAYLPLPSALIWPNIVGSAFWGFAVLGAWLSRTASPRETDGAIIVPDVVVTALALMFVRLLVPGLRFVR
jgi:hypothetical protein